MKNEKEFEIEIKADILKKAVNALCQITDDAKFSIDAEGIRTTMPDAGKMCLVFVQVLPKMCKSFKAKKTEIAVSLFSSYGKGLRDLLKLAGADQIVTLSKDGGDNRLIVEFGSIKRRLPLLNLEEFKSPKIPEIPFTTTVDIRADEFMTALKAANQIGDTVTLTAHPEKMTVSIQDHSDDFRAVLRKDEEMEYFDTNGKDEGMYSIEFLEKGLKEAKSTEPVTLRYANDSPIKISYGYDEDAMTIEYLFAPRVKKE